jgi:Fic family protein
MNDLLPTIDEYQERINALRPLPEETAASLKEYFRIGLTWSSNALEGNSLTESETKVVVEDGLTIGGKPLRDHLEASGHAHAFEKMMELTGAKRLKEEDILEFHRLFYHKIDEQKAGRWRRVPVVISGSRYPLPGPDKVPGLMRKLPDTISRQRKENHPVVAAARAHLDFVFIHPFTDGNGRVARLIMNLILLQEGYTIALIPPVLRAGYIALLEEAREDDRNFVDLICRCVHETQKDYLRILDL